MSSQRERKFLRLVKLSLGVSQRVTRLYTEFDILKKDSFEKFVDDHKHVIFHLWSNRASCCECSKYPGYVLPQNQVLNKEKQFDKICILTGNYNNKHYIRSSSRTVRNCICAVNTKPNCSLEDIDITVIGALLRNCISLPPIEEDWLKEIVEIRNKVSHANSTTFYDDSDLDNWLQRLETAILGLASKISSKSIVSGIQNEVKLLKNVNLTEEDFAEIIESVQENTQLLSSLKAFFEENIRTVIEKQGELSTDIKDLRQRILEYLRNEFHEFKVEIKDLVFEIKCCNKQYRIQQPALDVHERENAIDDDICEVRWHLSTPNDWNVERIKEILKNLMSITTVGGFKINFVYDGSLVIHSTALRGTVDSTEKLQATIEYFLQEFVTICCIDSNKKQTVNIEVSVNSQSTNSDSKIIDVLRSENNCQHCKKMFDCNPCLKKKQLIKDVLTRNVDALKTKDAVYQERKDIEPTESCVSQSDGCGFLTIETATSTKRVSDKPKLQASIKSFLEELVKKCDIDTSNKQTVNISLSVLNPRYIESEVVDILKTDTTCPHCERIFECHSCCSKIDFVKDLFIESDGKPTVKDDTEVTYWEKTKTENTQASYKEKAHTDDRKDKLSSNDDYDMHWPLPKSSSTGNGLFVVALDIGTTYSGYAYSVRSKYEQDLRIISNKPWCAKSSRLLSLKTATAILFNKEEEFLEFGFDAEEEYTDICIEGDADNYFFFSNFKMALYQHKPSSLDKPYSIGQKNVGVSRNLMLTDYREKPMAALKVFSKSIRFLMNHAKNVIRNSFSHERISSDDFHWILTVPAIWSDQSKSFMREAAIEAGIPSGQLSLADEPEVAAIYCRYMLNDTKGPRPISFDKGKQFMVLDCGGGTVDITSYEIQDDSHFKEIAQPRGGPWGGMYVDQEYINFLIDIFGEDVWEAFKRDNPDYVLNIRNSFEVTKRTVDQGVKRKMRIAIPFSLYGTYSEITGTDFGAYLKKSRFSQMVEKRNHYLVLSPEVIAQFFSKSINAIVSEVKNLLHDAKEKGKHIETLLMVGGFSESKILQGVMRTNFSSLTHICPEEAILTVLKGAVVFGNMPATVTTRISRYTYGIHVNVPFDDQKDISKKEIIEGREMCTEVFYALVKSGQPVTIDEAFSVRCRPTRSTDVLATVQIFISDVSDPMYITDGGVQQIGELSVNIPDVSRGKNRIIRTEFYFDKTELRVVALEEGGDNRQVVLNLLI